MLEECWRQKEAGERHLGGGVDGVACTQEKCQPAATGASCSGVGRPWRLLLTTATVIVETSCVCSLMRYW